MTENIKTMNKWTEFGNRLEAIFYSSSNAPEGSGSLAEWRKCVKEYEALQADINSFQNNQSPDTQNFLTDLLHVVARVTVLKQRDKWLDLDEGAATV